MIKLTLNNISNLNVSLQVGDLIYARTIDTKPGANDAQQDTGGLYTPTNIQNAVGILTQINVLTGNNVELSIDETDFSLPYIPVAGDFIMFSKYNQVVGDVMGYYAQAKFTNSSREKAEIFSVGSEVIINSK